jgi:hypothetical protein
MTTLKTAITARANEDPAEHNIAQLLDWVRADPKRRTFGAQTDITDFNLLIQGQGQRHCCFHANKAAARPISQ